MRSFTNEDWMVMMKDRNTLRLSFHIALLIGAFLLPGLPCTVHGVPVPSTFSSPEFVIEELDANIHDSILVVSGKVRNNSFRSARGGIIIYLKDSGNGVINSVEENVNNGQPFAHGDRIPFEFNISMNVAPGARNLTVEFVEANSQNYPLAPPTQNQNSLDVVNKPIVNTPPTGVSGRSQITGPTGAAPNEISEKTKKCQAKGGNWINNQCVIPIN